MRLEENPQLPINPDTAYAKDLNFTLTRTFRGISQKVNAIADGRITAIDNAQTSVPTTGKWRQGDFVRNSTPSVITSTPNYVVLGWECIASGEPGTWVAVTTPEVPSGDGAWTSAALGGIAASVGTITTKSGTIRYIKRGRTVTFNLQIAITANGTGAQWLLATLPFVAAAETIFVGQEVLLTGYATTGYVDAGTSTLVIVKYDATYPGGNGTRNVITGVYESTT